ncbi:hypothetical protein T4B_154 [Trichinella pseudospiralis]|uniref:Uncharacterized protein n=1 Tax=Trichinella pseudospiralis TaxID=6337 RepID=A0A0V1IB21_TRIPS|nr:hypothetical protein T4B_154 [Trichinella pseudospiralis]
MLFIDIGIFILAKIISLMTELNKDGKNDDPTIWQHHLSLCVRCSTVARLYNLELWKIEH